MHNKFPIAFLLLLSLLFVRPVHAANTSTSACDSLLTAASKAYNNGEYSEAAAYYETVAAEYGISAKLYYNLGNAYYKAGEIARSRLNYERALRLAPHDKDIQFNLEMCEAMVVDKTESLGDFLLARWFRQVRELFASNVWSWLSIGLFWLFLISLCVFFFNKVRIWRKSFFIIAIISLIISVVSLIFATQSYRAQVFSDQAVVFEPSVTVKSSPDRSGNDLFLLHEGTKVSIKSTLGEWSEIVLEDGNVGWMPSSGLQVI